jgi:fatty-acyl-CoA synthase
MEPVIMVRTSDGTIAVLVNRCMHRGTMVCPADRGHARTFTCPYHGWTYDVSGALLGVPYPGGYAAFDKSTHGLARAPRVFELPRLRLRQPEPDRQPAL